MPGRLKRLSGKDVVVILRRFGFAVLSQRGSHAKLRRWGPKGEKQTLLVPLHGELATGTRRAIIRQATKYVPLDDLWPHFFTT